MEHHRYAGFPNHPEVALCQILQEAQHRWLRPTEVCEILRNYHKFKLTPDPPHKPQSGSLFLFDRKALRYFRKDGHNWRKKRDGKTVREAHERLKAGSVEVLHCYYAHGEDNENFQRRSYWMLDTHEHIVLVHYREVKEGNRSGMRSPNSYSVDGGNSRGVAGSSPQTSPLVSPRASSSNSVEWNGRTHSPENEEPESSDDTDQCHLQQVEPNRMVGTPAGVPTNNSRYLQTSGSFSAPKQNGFNYDKKPPLPTFFGGNGSVVAQQRTLGMQTAQGLPLKEENGTRVPPGGFDLLEWGEVLKQGKLWEGKGNGLHNDSFVELPDWTETLHQYSMQQHQDRVNALALPDVNLHYGHGDLKLAVHESPLSEALGAQLHASQGLPDVGMEASRKPNSSAVQWNAALGHAGDQGNLQSSVLGVFESDLLNESQQSQLHFTQSYMGVGQSLTSQNDSINKDITSFQPYSHVFQDFQADTPLQLEEQETFKKLDSFGRWINQEIGADAENSLLPVESDNDTIWASALDDHGAVDVSLAQQMQLDVGSLPFLSHQQCFIISDFSPSTGICTAETKVLVTGSFTHAIEDPTASKWCCMFGDIEVPAELLQPGVLRCNAPPHAASKVCFYITRNDRVPCSDIREFEYQPELNSSRKETSGEGIGGGALSKRDMLFQIRLARMLSSGAMPLESSRLDETSKWDNDLNPLSCYEEWEDLEVQLTESGCLSQTLKEKLIEKMLKEKLSLWLLKRAFVGGKGASVLDDHGLGVLHMGAALGYTWIISPVLAAGVNINFRDSRGRTALHWAAHCGREAMVVVLLAAGAAPGAKADPTTKFPGGQTPADLASIEQHKGIAGYLAESSLTSHLSSLTLKSNMDGTIPSSLTGKSVVETVSERTVVQPNIGQSEEQVSLQDSLAAVRNATQAAARIQSAFRAHSFRKKQDLLSLQEDEYGISNEEAQYLVAAQRTSKGASMHEDDISRSAAVRIQQKFRGWKGRREFLLFRQHVVKIQAHFRGHQVRKHYGKILWSVGIVEKAILRWRRKGRGLRGFCADGSTTNGNDDFLKAGRKQIEVGLEQALARVQSMVRSPEAREQYRRLVDGYQKTKSHFEGDTSPRSDNKDDVLYTHNFPML